MISILFKEGFHLWTKFLYGSDLSQCLTFNRKKLEDNPVKIYF